MTGFQKIFLFFSKIFKNKKLRHCPKGQNRSVLLESYIVMYAVIRYNEEIIAAKLFPQTFYKYPDNILLFDRDSHRHTDIRARRLL